MGNYEEALQKVHSEVAPLVNDLYEYFRGKKQLEEETDVERQLEILTSKKYISITYITDLSLIADYCARSMVREYLSELEHYKMRILLFLEG